MHEWPRTITIGQQGEGYFPMAIFKAIGPAVIRFSVSSSQTGARTLQIGITLAFAGRFLHIILETNLSIKLVHQAVAPR
jgi:rhamnogalacturonan endolyase